MVNFAHHCDLVILCLSILSLLPNAYGSEKIGETKKVAFPLEEVQKRLLEKKKSKSELSGFPLVFKTPETGWGAGAVLVYFPKKLYKKASPLISGVMVTEKSQFLWALGTKQYFNEDQYGLQAQIEATRFPDRFFGLGKETDNTNYQEFVENKRNIKVGIERRIWGSLSTVLGLQIRKDTLDFSKEEKIGNPSVEPAWRGQTVVGRKGGTIRGYRLQLFWDSTDDTFYPTQGEKTLFDVARFSKNLGSDYEFYNQKLDSRFYYSLGPDSTVANQFLWHQSEGDVPFYMLPRIGGKDILRGYYQGRFRGKFLTALQMEHRYQISKRWAWVQFAGMGDIGNKTSDLFSEGGKLSYGTGGRFLITSSQKVNLRLDLGWGDTGTVPSVYVHVMEAF